MIPSDINNNAIAVPRLAIDDDSKKTRTNKLSWGGETAGKSPLLVPDSVDGLERGMSLYIHQLRRIQDLSMRSFGQRHGTSVPSFGQVVVLGLTLVPWTDRCKRAVSKKANL